MPAGSSLCSSGPIQIRLPRGARPALCRCSGPDAPPAAGIARGGRARTATGVWMDEVPGNNASESTSRRLPSPISSRVPCSLNRSSTRRIWSRSLAVRSSHVSAGSILLLQKAIPYAWPCRVDETLQVPRATARHEDLDPPEPDRPSAAGTPPRAPASSSASRTLLPSRIGVHENRGNFTGPRPPRSAPHG